MGECGEIAQAIRRIVADTWPARFAGVDLPQDVVLGEDGLGFDSVEVVELLLACEEYCGIQIDQSLFDGPPLTIERIAQYIADA